jgi:hypothetical protein
VAAASDVLHLSIGGCPFRVGDPGEIEEGHSMEHMQNQPTLSGSPVVAHDDTGVRCRDGSERPNPETSGLLGYGAVYAVGRVEPRFPRLEVEKEFAQVTGRSAVAGMTDRQALHAVLSRRENRYLARQLCWVFTIEGLETYILQTRDPADLDLLVDALRSTPSPLDVDVVIGIRGPVAQPELCNGLMIPIVLFEQLYSFDRDSLVKAIPKPEKTAAKQFEAASAELFDRIVQMADNAGATDADRALNYLVVRYPAIYVLTAERQAQNSSLSAVEVRPSPLAGTRRVVEVIFSYTNRNTDVTEKFSVRVDVTGLFPFLLAKLSAYFDR